MQGTALEKTPTMSTSYKSNRLGGPQKASGREQVFKDESDFTTSDGGEGTLKHLQAF